MTIKAGGMSCTRMFPGEQSGEGDVYLKSLAANQHGHLDPQLLREWHTTASTAVEQQTGLVLSLARKQQLPHQLARAELKQLGIKPAAEDYARARKYKHSDLADGPFAHVRTLLDVPQDA